MTKRNKGYSAEPGPHFCFFRCGAVLRDKFDFTENREWRWCTQYGEKPVHFCPRCTQTRYGEIAEIERQLKIRPRDYPESRAQIVLRGMVMNVDGRASGMESHASIQDEGGEDVKK